ncbi:MAG: hypothetical protein K9G67_03735 [Bacteroidales bacterium]|nr:hypothetical protein [Bacteroidales bacterium]MCF8349924.1 hypothetical protein [Bacteroidales bacterium]MCF8375441.1 hypothetical protein [Bacteroidales bacterium]MCF8401355.1 hypothetical protein [Bacteroidales bacterium]
MKTAELKNHIIKRVLDTEDKDLLAYLNSLLEKNDDAEIYKLNSFEKQVINESLADYEKGNTIS